MADNSANVGSIRKYLADRGGSVEDAGGRGLTDEMARALGVDRPATLSGLLGEMENDGIITRDMRGLRTYRIALVDASDEAPASGGAPPASGGTLLADNGAGAEAPASTPPFGHSGRRSLRMPRTTEPSPAGEVPAAPGPSRAAASGAPAGAAGGPPAPTAGKAVSLREAIARQSAAGAAPPAPSEATPEAAAPAVDSVDAPSTPEAAAPAVDSVDAPATPRAPGAAPSRPTGRAVSLREALAASGETIATSDAADAVEAPPIRTLRPGSRFAGPRPLGASAPSSTPSPTAQMPTFVAPPPRSAAAAAASAPAPDVAARRERVPRAPKRQARTLRSRLSVPLPEVRTAPTRGIITAVALAIAGLVLITVITVIVAGTESHPQIGLNQLTPSPDACNIVTSSMASAIFGDDAGRPNFVLGECVYQDATHLLLVQDYHQDAQAVYNATHTSAAQAVPGIGDAAYYVGGSLWVQKGTSIMEITLGSPTPPATPSAQVLTLAREAVPRLSSTP